MVYASTAGRDSTRNVPTAPEERRALLPRRRRGARAGRGRACASRSTTARAPARPTPMDIEWAQGRRRRQAVHRPGPARNGGLANARGLDRRVPAAGHAARCWREGRAVGSQDRQSARARGRRACRTSWRQFQPGEVLVADTTMPDWGTVMKTAAGRRDQPRRPHLPRGDRRARAGHPGRGRLRQRDRRHPHRRRRSRWRAPGGSAGRVYAGSLPFDTRREIDVAALPRPHTRSDGQHRQPRHRLPGGAAAQRRRGPGAHGVHRRRARAARTRWRWLHPERVEDPAVARGAWRSWRRATRAAPTISCAQLSEGVAHHRRRLLSRGR